MVILFVLLCFFCWAILLSFIWGDSQNKHNIVFYCTGCVLISLSLFLDKTVLPDYEQYVSYFRIAIDHFSLEPTMILLSYLINAFFANEVFWGFAIYLLGDRLAQQKIIFQGTKYISIILCYCCFAIMCVSPELLVVYVGEEYLNLVFWLDIWLLTTLANHNQAISCLILSGSDIKAITYSTILSSIVGLVLCWILVAKFAVGGTVIAYAVYLLLQMCFYYLYYWPKVMKIDSKKVFKESFMPFVIIGLIGAVVFRSILLTSSVWNELVLKGTFFTVYYFVFIIIVSKKADRDFINGILKR